jgi:choline dehydrogenase-like flavoprotein
MVETDSRRTASMPLVAEIAIVGAGPAGIVLALELARSGHDVLLIESGGDAPRAEAQQLGDLRTDDPYHVSMSLATSRQFGGASNLWGGRCVPFDPLDFKPRAIANRASWPVDYAEITPYFQRACDWFLCGQASFSVTDIPKLARRSIVPGFPDGEVSASSLERWSLPTNFARVYRAALAGASGVRLIKNLTCTEIVTDASGRVAHLQASSLEGTEIEIRATRYVLACGGLETTRLLLASKRRDRDGLGNRAGHLGRYYMAHVECRIAQVHFSTAPEETIYDHERDSDGVYVRRRLTFSEECLDEHELPNIAMWLVNPEMSDPSHGSGVLSFAYLMLASPFGRRFVAEGIRQAHAKPVDVAQIRRHLLNVLRGFGPTIRFAFSFGYRRYLKRGRKVPGFFVKSAVNTYPILYHAEHLPHRDSFVELTPENDATGLPRLRTNLHFDMRDITSVVRAHERLDAYLRKHGLGHVEFIYDDPEAAVREQLFGGYHQAGTTRMSELESDGVVDRNLAVHSCENLFVASSSTFVTSGQANSTFTLIVFALRLADHLHQLSEDESETIRAPARHASASVGL